MATATGIADNCDPTRSWSTRSSLRPPGLSVPAGPSLPLLRSSRSSGSWEICFPRLRASSRIPDHRGVWVRRKRKVSANAETVSKPVPDRTRGHVALALLAMGAMNVLLVVALVVAVLT